MPCCSLERLDRDQVARLAVVGISGVGAMATDFVKVANLNWTRYKDGFDHVSAGLLNAV